MRKRPHSYLSRPHTRPSRGSRSWRRPFHTGRQSTPQRPWHRNWSNDRDKAPPHPGQTQFAIADVSLSFDSSLLSISRNRLFINICRPPCSLLSLTKHAHFACTLYAMYLQCRGIAERTRRCPEAKIRHYNQIKEIFRRKR